VTSKGRFGGNTMDAANYPQWEHHIEYITAEAYITEKQGKGLFASSNSYPKSFMVNYYTGKELPLYAVEAIIPRLDELGTQGWELVQMQPVIVGNNGDIRVGFADISHWTHTYLCTFKRPKRSDQTYDGDVLL
jgi:hypothetical protein